MQHNYILFDKIKYMGKDNRIKINVQLSGTTCEILMLLAN